jgi:tetratricopeptide (TPR) repeat protein
MSKRLEALQKMVASGTPDPFARYALAMELKSLGRLDESLAAFRELREKDPAYVPQYLMAGGVAATLGQNDVAREILEEGVRRAMAKGDQHTASEIQTALAALPSS